MCAKLPGEMSENTHPVLISSQDEHQNLLIGEA